MITEITATEGGVRLDVFLAEKLPELSRSAARRLMEGGSVTLKGEPVRKNHKTSAGEVFEVRLPESDEAEILPENIPLDIAYEDGDVIVINKPRGMVVHPAPGHTKGTLVNALLYRYPGALSDINGAERPGILHRIDKDTSGLLLAVKNNAAHEALARQLKDHDIERVYEAVVCGVVKEDSGTVDVPIGRHAGDRKKQSVKTNKARDAVTHFTVIGRYPGYTHMECRLETGRTHQIRVHMAHIGHPVLGDTVYGRKKPEKGLSSQCLHARTLKFTHPATGEILEITSELPEYFKDVLKRLGNEI